MTSPFPGMDPYLEAYWSDVQSRVAVYASDHLAPQLPQALRARVHQSVAVEADDDPRGRTAYYPDVQVSDAGTDGGRGGAAVAASAEPLILPRPARRSVRRSVRIVTADGNRLVTAIEFLSPSNKVGQSERAAFRRKQATVLAGGASVAEIDLVRAGRHALAVGLAQVPAAHRKGYKAVVVRGWSRERAEFYPLPLRAALPAIRIPLRRTDPDAALDLQALIRQAYANGGYDATDYRKPPEPRLGAEDEAWAEELLRGAGKR